MEPTTRRLVDAVSKAVQAEVEGYHFYMMAAKSCTDESGRVMFECLAADEVEHARYLREQHASLVATGQGHQGRVYKLPAEVSHEEALFSAALTTRAKEARYEMSALSIGMQLELSAVQFYEAEAGKSVDPAVRELFHSLAEWESSHYRRLERIFGLLKESYFKGGLPPELSGSSGTLA